MNIRVEQFSTNNPNPEKRLCKSEAHEMNLKLAEIVDVHAIQSLMDDFYKFAHITMALVDLNGNVLINVGWQDICTKFHRINPQSCMYCIESDTKLSTGVAPGDFKLYKCKNNMWDIVTPIIVGGLHIGNIFSGQFFFEDEPLDYELFRAQARKYGFNEKEYIAALKKVPRMSREAVKTSMSFFMKLANMISQLSYSNIKLAQSLEERENLVGKLKENKKDFDLAQAVGSIGSWRLDVCKNELIWSDENHHIFGIPKGTLLTYETFLSTVHPDDREYVDKEWKAGLEGKSYDIEHRIIANDKVKWVREKAYLEFDSNGMLLGGFGITQDITERKVAEDSLKKTLDNLEKIVEERTIQLERAYKSLQESEKGLSEAQRIAHIGNWEWDITTGKTYWSQEMYHIFALDPNISSPTHNEFLNYIHPDDLDYVDGAIKKALNGKPFGIDFRILTANGEERIVNAEIEVTFDLFNKPILAKGTTQDITERKKAEKALASIEISRKKEIHHRIKNNLQVISSLLDLQAEKFRNRECIDDSEVLRAFKESQDRVISMALIHEELYKGEGFETLNFSPYIKELTENLLLTYRLNKNVTLSTDLEENLLFDMDTAVPLGMIVNELVSNSIKHAFVDRKMGEIRIKLIREENEKCLKGTTKEFNVANFVLTVSDNGVGIPKNLDIENLDSLGFQLITSLIDQLDGEFELKRNNGTEFTLRFTTKKEKLKSQHQ